MATSTTIESLPNEILISILSALPTHDLRVLAAVGHRFYSVVLRILHFRLTQAAPLPDHCLILECYHPSDKISTPYLYCDYLGTDDLPGEREYGAQGLAMLNQLYSHFRPVVQDENRRPRARYPTQDRVQIQAQRQDQQQGSSTQTLGTFATAASPEQPAFASETVRLEDGELFSQLCTVTNLVKVGPRRGFFLSHVSVGEGVIRVWRNWLAAQGGTRAGLEENEDDGAILWADSARNVGLRFGVVETDDSRARRPLLVDASHANEDLPVSYKLEYRELLVRTNQLLLMVEKSEVQEVTTSGKAIVIASP